MIGAEKIPRPGTSHGPCARPCTHPMCVQMRAVAEAPCNICFRPIGYDTLHSWADETTTDLDDVAHTDCARRLATARSSQPAGRPKAKRRR